MVYIIFCIFYNKRFVFEGLEAVLGIAPNSGVYRKKINRDVEARLIMIACCDPYEGYPIF